ncbi:gamma carbonic anhydrase family protein, partial [[Flexibacter] sp. ATCC 35208]
MPYILPEKGVMPEMGKDCFIAPNATIVGDVIMDNDGSCWVNDMIRGDVNTIRLGNEVNVQDGASSRATCEKTTTIIG